MPSDPPPPPDDPGERAAKRGAQVALMIFSGFALLFCLSSTWQLGRAVFAEPAPAAATARAAPCVEQGPADHR